jgi:hypothetical protein
MLSTILVRSSWKLSPRSSHLWMYGLLWCADLRIHLSSFPPRSRFKLQELHGITWYFFRIRRSALPISAGGSEHDAERGNHMAVTDSQTLQRLRSEESLAEQQGRQALNIAAILKNHPQYDAARLKADTLLAKASALREQIVKIETV